MGRLWFWSMVLSPFLFPGALLGVEKTPPGQVSPTPTVTDVPTWPVHGEHSRIPVNIFPETWTPTAGTSLASPTPVEGTPSPTPIPPLVRSSPAVAEKAVPKNFYAGVYLSFERLGGGFNGSRLYVTSDSVSLLAPKLDPELGFGLEGGVLGPQLPAPLERLDGEIWVERSVQRWVFQDGQDASVYFALGADARIGFLKDLPVQPFLLLGLQAYWLGLKDAAEAPGFRIAGASYGGLGLDLGFGASYDLPWGFKVSARWLFRPTLIAGGSAFNSALDKGPSLDGGGLRIGTEYYF